MWDRDEIIQKHIQQVGGMSQFHPMPLILLDNWLFYTSHSNHVTMCSLFVCTAALDVVSKAQLDPAAVCTYWAWFMGKDPIRTRSLSHGTGPDGKVDSSSKADLRRRFYRFTLERLGCCWPVLLLLGGGGGGGAVSEVMRCFEMLSALKDACVSALNTRMVLLLIWIGIWGCMSLRWRVVGWVRRSLRPAPDLSELPDRYGRRWEVVCRNLTSGPASAVAFEDPS